jgi:hypothetical protein
MKPTGYRDGGLFWAWMIVSNASGQILTLFDRRTAFAAKAILGI